MAANDPLEICPLDSAHQILKSRMQTHLVKCMKNHNLEDKMICPYNSVHIVDKIVFQNHVANCPDYREVHAFVYKTDCTELNGIVTMEEVTQAHGRPADTGEENWDDGVVCPTYDPMKNSEGKPILRSLNVASKAKRREFRMRERERMAQLTEHTPTPAQSDNVDQKKKSTEPLRPPRKTVIDEPNRDSLSKPLRIPRNLQTPSPDGEENGLPLPKTSLDPVVEENHDAAAVTEETKTSGKFKKAPPRRQPHLNSEGAGQKSKTGGERLPEKSKMNSYSGALRSDRPREPQKNGINSTAQSDINSIIQQQLRELNETKKKAEAEEQRLMKLLEANMQDRGFEGLAAEQAKKVGRCAAKFA